MVRPLTRSRLVPGVLALVMAFVSSATCLAAVLLGDKSERHACCAGISEACTDGTMTAQEDCCAVQSADRARVASTLFVVVTSVATCPAAVHSATGSVGRGTAFEPGIPKPSSSAPYLLHSVFRI